MKRSAGFARGSADVMSGTHDRLDAAARVYGTVGRTSLLLDGGRRQIGLTPGITRDGGARNQQWDVLIKAARVMSPAARVEANALIVDESQRWQTGQLYNFADNLQLAGRATASLQVRGHALTPTLSFSQFRHTPSRSSTTV